MTWRKLTDEQWEKIRVHLPPHPEHPYGGRPFADDRKCFEGILWILRTGAHWAELPRCYASPATCWRRLRQWEQDGTLIRMWRDFLAELNSCNRVEWEQCFGDAYFVPAKKGDLRSEKPSEARAPRSCLYPTATGRQLANSSSQLPRPKSIWSRRRSRPYRSVEPIKPDDRVGVRSA